MKIATFVALLLTLGLLSAACLPDLHWRSEAERKSAPAPAPPKPPTPKPTETPLPTDTPVPVLIPTADELRLDPTLLDEWAYSDCLDEIYLRAHASYSSDHWLPAAVWHCQHLAPPPSNDLYPNRCILNSVRSASARYPEWNKLLTHWYAITQCYPDATASRSQPDLPDVVVTDYGACLDNVFLTLLHRIDDGDMHVGISAWYCQRYLPIPAPSEECQDTHMDATDVLYSEWPEAMHRWHAVMHCEPHWSPPDDATGDFYEACLDGVYRSVNEGPQQEGGDSGGGLALPCAHAGAAGLLPSAL